MKTFAPTTRTRKMPARLKVMSLVAACSLVLSACGGGSGSGADDNALTVWQNSTTGPGKQFWTDAAAAFTAANPGVTVDVQSIQNEDMDGRLQTAVNSGDMPDVFMARGGGKLADMVDAGVVKDLSDKIDPAVKTDMGDAVLGAFTIDDTLYAVPTAVLPGGMFYSQDLFASSGIAAPPKTFAELDTAVTALKASSVEPIALGAKDAWPAAHWYYFFALRTCSEDVIQNIATTRDFSDPCWLDAATALKTFTDSEPFNKGFLTTSAQQGAGSSAGLLANHKAAMELMGGWDVGVIASLTPDQKPLPDLNWFPFPAVEGGKGDPTAIMGGVDGYACSVDSPDSCEKFLNFISTEEWQSKYAEAYQTIPAVKSAQDSVTEPALKPLMEAYNNAAYVTVWLDTSLGQNVGNSLNSAVVQLISGKGTPEDLITTVSTAAKRG